MAMRKKAGLHTSKARIAQGGGISSARLAIASRRLDSNSSRPRGWGEYLDLEGELRLYQRSRLTHRASSLARPMAGSGRVALHGFCHGVKPLSNVQELSAHRLIFRVGGLATDACGFSPITLRGEPDSLLPAVGHRLLREANSPLVDPLLCVGQDPPMDGRAYKTAGRKQMASKHSALDLIERIGRKSGLLIMPLWRTERLDLATHTEQILAHCRIDTVLDVGANKGQYRDFLREEVGWPGPIISFEPIPDLAAELRSPNQDHHWRIEEFALGNVEGSKPLNVAASPGFSSFLEPEASQVDLFSKRNLDANCI